MMAGLLSSMPWCCLMCGTWPHFWGGKCDLVAHCVVAQPHSLGGSAVGDFFSKVSALHVQWVRWFVVSHNHIKAHSKLTL